MSITAPSNGDAFETGMNITVSGTAREGSTVTVYIGDQAAGNTTAYGPNGQWSHMLDNLVPGSHTITATAMQGGLTSDSSDPVTVIVTEEGQPIQPTEPVITMPADGTIILTDMIEIAGTAEPSTTVMVYSNATAATPLGQTTTTADGEWTVRVTLEPGNHEITATATLGGSVSDPSSAITLTAMASPEYKPWTQALIDKRSAKPDQFKENFPVDTDAGINRLLAWAGNTEPGKAQDLEPELARYDFLYSAMKRWDERPDLQGFVPEASLADDARILAMWAGHPQVQNQTDPNKEPNRDLFNFTETYTLIRYYVLERDDLRNQMPEVLTDWDLRNLYCWAARDNANVVENINANRGEFGYVNVDDSFVQFYRDACESNMHSSFGLAGTVNVGLLMPTTGTFGEYGEEAASGSRISVADINARLAAENAGWSINLTFADTATDPTIAEAELMSLYESGIHLVLGPMTSAPIERVIEYANQNNMVLISSSSTAPSLAVSNDSVFRLIPNDTNQGPAIAAMLDHNNIDTVIPVVRDDVWGRDLINFTRTAFESDNNTMSTSIFYSTDTTDFADVVQSMADALAATTTAGSGTAVLFVGFNEFTDLAAAAAQHDDLSSVPWFGADGVSRSSVVIADETATDFAELVNMSAPVFHVPANPTYDSVSARIQSDIGREPGSYALAAYDAAQILALAIESFDTADGLAVRNTFNGVANGYTGALGDVMMTPEGDLVGTYYAIWAVENGQWVHAATYSVETGAVTPEP